MRTCVGLLRRWSRADMSFIATGGTYVRGVASCRAEEGYCSRWTREHVHPRRNAVHSV